MNRSTFRTPLIGLLAGLIVFCIAAFAGDPSGPLVVRDPSVQALLLQGLNQGRQPLAVEETATRPDRQVRAVTPGRMHLRVDAGTGAIAAQSAPPSLPPTALRLLGADDAAQTGLRMADQPAARLFVNEPAPAPPVQPVQLLPRGVKAPVPAQPGRQAPPQSHRQAPAEETDTTGQLQIREGLIARPTTGARTGMQPDFDIRSEERPKVLRYACCDGVEVRSEPGWDQSVVAALKPGEQVWVFDILGTGAPAGIGSCGPGFPTSCGTLWAEAHVPSHNLSGYVPLNALFVRAIEPSANELVFEIGYGKLAEYLREGVRQGLVEPKDCSSPGHAISVNGSDVGNRDSYFFPDGKSRVPCDELLAMDCEYKLHSCEKLAAGDNGWGECVYQSMAECRSGQRPERAPASGQYICMQTCPNGRGVCGACRQWYADPRLPDTQILEGWNALRQNQSGWKTELELVNWCDNNPPPHSTPGVGGNGAGPCAEWMQTYNVSSCRFYVGPVDTRYYGNPADYECGEYPFGRTHAGYEQNIANPGYAGSVNFSGSPDPTWKWLTTFNLLDKTAVIEMGRLPKQRAFQFSQSDLTHGSVRTLNVPAGLAERNFWLAFEPRRVSIDGKQTDVLNVRACMHLPGTEIKGEAIEFNPTDKYFPLIREIRFGKATIQRLKMCARARIRLDSDYRPELLWAQIEDDSFEVQVTGLSGAGIDPGPAGLMSALRMPLSRVMLAAILGVKYAEVSLNQAGVQHFLANFAVEAFSAGAINTLNPILEREIANALESVRVNPRERLEAVCEPLDPQVTTSHPFYYFYHFLHGQCEGFVDSHGARPFLPNEASMEAGCYAGEAFVTPADAGSSRWWGQYLGQQWFYPFYPDRGCRLAASISSNLDRDIWPTLRCAAMVFNAWHNNGPTPPGASLQQMIGNSCSGLAVRALQAYYGDGQDLIDLYQQVHQPTGPGGSTREMRGR